MFFYTNVLQDSNEILFRGYKDGKKIQQKVKYSPSLFIENKFGEYESLDGTKLSRKRFDTISDLKDHIKNFETVDNVTLYGTGKMDVQFINDYFKKNYNLEYNFQLLNIKSIDIETKVDVANIDTENVPNEITLITLKDFHTKEIKTFGCWDFKLDFERIDKFLKKQNLTLDRNRLQKFEYVKCANEKDLLEKFIGYWSSDYPDIVTGWNIDNFDIPYLSNRISKVLNDRFLKKCSPWGSVEKKYVNLTDDREILTFLWDGISILDHMVLYKKFSGKSLVNYALTTVSKEELKRDKLSHDYGSFQNFYEQDPYMFTVYNIIDVDLVDALEEKTKLIQLIVDIAYQSGVNYNNVFSKIASWEGILYNYFLSKKIVPNLRSKIKTRKRILGGYVKEIEPTSHDWNVAFDATSLYPSIIMALNMSPETIVDCPLYPSSDETIDKIIDFSYDLDFLKDKNRSIAANGQQFTNEKEGWFPIIIKGFFGDRQMFKKEMLNLESTDPKNPKIPMLNIKQMTIKILLNSLYGAMANEHFIFYDPRIAEGITMTGQAIIRINERKINTFLENYFQKPGQYCYYCDTDSLHITLNEIVKRDYIGLDNRTVSKKLSDVCEDLLSPEIQKICSELGDYMNFFDPKKISFKREFIASRGVYTAKKRYCLNVYNSEGVEYDPPKIKIMGLEIIRTTTPLIVKDKLREGVKIILTKENKDLIKFIEEFKEEYMKLDYDSISCPTSLNNLIKYEVQGEVTGYAKGTPMHVKSAINFNNMLNKFDIKNLERIHDGDKIKYLILKEPNPLGEEVLGYKDLLPTELDIIKFIDYNRMLDKTFLAPISRIAEAIKWDIEKKATLKGLFR